MDDNLGEEHLHSIYRNRLGARDLDNKRILWGVLVKDYLQKYVPATGTVVDLGAGNCEFINEVRALRRIAVDLNPDTVDFADPGVEVLTTRSDCMRTLDDESVETVFTSNFFEHLPTKGDLLSTLAECRRVTVRVGCSSYLNTNIRYLPGRYWDYFDHHLPLTHLSLSEALELSGYDVVERVWEVLAVHRQGCALRRSPGDGPDLPQAAAGVAPVRPPDAGRRPKALTAPKRARSRPVPSRGGPTG